VILTHEKILKVAKLNERIETLLEMSRAQLAANGQFCSENIASNLRVFAQWALITAEDLEK